MTTNPSRCLWPLALVLAIAPLFAQTSRVSPIVPRTIPEGATFLIRLDDKLDTGRAHPGQHFKARLAEDLTGPDGTVLPRGRKIKGHVSAADHGLHPRMLLSFDEIQTDHGWIPLIATVTGVPGERAAATPDDQGTIERKDTSKHRSSDSTSGASSDDDGHGIRARVSALAAFLSDHNLTLDKGTIIEARLDHRLQVPSR